MLTIEQRRIMHKWLNSKSKILLLTLAFICLVFLLSGFFFVNRASFSEDSKDQPYLLSESSEKITPTWIKIPSIGVNAVIKPVGLTELKTMQSPEKPEETAWFELGVSPGEKGSSVIAGHRGYKTGKAVFDDLDKIQIGDKVYVEDDEKNTLVFVVREIRHYNADDIVFEVWNKEDSAYLNLITCFGEWSAETGTSDKRLVVFTDLVI